jgi:antitoxin component of MazEF toxin-antitoxin module
VKKLTGTGNSVALVLDKELLERTGLDPEKPVEVSTHGELIILSPVRDSKHSRRLEQIIGRAGRQVRPGVQEARRVKDPLFPCGIVNGAVECLGYRFFGQLGNDGTADSLVPVAVGPWAP